MKPICEKDLIPGKIYRAIGSDVRIKFFGISGGRIAFSGIKGSEKEYRHALREDGYITFIYQPKYEWGYYMTDNPIKFGRKSIAVI